MYTAQPIFAIIPATIKAKGRGRREASLFYLPTVGNRREIEAGVLMKSIERFWTEVMPRVA